MTTATLTAPPAAAAQHWALGWLGVPYQPDGTSRAGANCWTFFCMVMLAQYGQRFCPVQVVAPADAADAAGLRNMLAEFQRSDMYTGYMPVPAAQAQEGDVMLLAHRTGWPDHIGIVVSLPGGVGGLRVLHCARGVGAACEPLARVASRWRIAEFWRRSE